MNKINNLRNIVLATCAVASTLLGATVAAQTQAQVYPNKPLRLINPFAAGGGADIIARYIASKLSENLGQPVVVESKPGAGSMVGSDYAAKAAPDGYTLLQVTGAYPVVAAMQRKLPFDPLKDISMVSMLTVYPFVLTVSSASADKTLSDLIARAKASPGKLSYATAGNGSVHHLCSELLNASAGIEILHIPFKGGTAPLVELMAGRIDMVCETMTAALPHIQGGKLRALGVASSERDKAMPDVPTIAQTLPGFEVTSFNGIGVTGGTSPAIIERLNRAVREVLSTPDAQKRFVEFGGAPKASSPKEMLDYVERETNKWRKLIDVRKIERL